MEFSDQPLPFLQRINISDSATIHFRQLLACLVTILCAFLLRRKSVRQFPGPPAWPIIGNLASIYHCHAERQIFEWAKVHGDVVQVQFGSLTTLVVNSAAAAKEIFAGSATALSSRPVFHTFHNIIAGTLGPTIGTAGYGDALKKGRKTTAAELSKPAVKANLDKIDLETRHLLQEILIYGSEGQNPMLVSKPIKRLTLSLSLSICYGRRVYLGDPLTHDIIDVEDEILKYRSMTDNLQDYISFFRVWPLNSYYSKAVELRKRRDAYVLKLNQEIEAKLQAGTHEDCLYAKNMASAHPLPVQELSTVLLTFLSGGLATASSTIHWSLTLLAKRPDIQDTAYKAIREVYANDEQLFEACLADKEDIPYISALVRESLRYYTPSRLALPRLTVQPFQYEGKVIPEGTTVMLNTFACNMDPKVFEDPETFCPERWLKHPELPIFSYGLGYRMCAGYTLANREMYILLARIIALFEISPTTETDANHITGCADPAHQAMAPRNSGLYFRPRNVDKIKVILGNGSVNVFLMSANTMAASEHIPKTCFKCCGILLIVST
ncbi:Cytochrome P450 [Penicillium mononematosum]|uniref:Cytochrome P450 n=1 Tax=Penicillium mononematosum TaxID=268346 RepID=UPI00254863BC|nr:Cytochrome P450 [Penicillium mononematosum]KAJ6184687.1 Cytochrome P450 [Penicillium mononematosum]